MHSHPAHYPRKNHPPRHSSQTALSSPPNSHPRRNMHRYRQHRLVPRHSKNHSITHDNSTALYVRNNIDSQTTKYPNDKNASIYHPHTILNRLPASSTLIHSSHPFNRSFSRLFASRSFSSMTQPMQSQKLYSSMSNVDKSHLETAIVGIGCYWGMLFTLFATKLPCCC